MENIYNVFKVSKHRDKLRDRLAITCRIGYIERHELIDSEELQLPYGDTAYTLNERSCEACDK